MTRNRLKNARFLIAALSCFLILPGTLAGVAQDRRLERGPQVDETETSSPTDPIASMPHKRKQELLKSKLEHMRKDAAEMTKLVDSIQEDLEKTTENELPLRVVTKAEQVEKLAKRIKNAAKGF